MEVLLSNLHKMIKLVSSAQEATENELFGLGLQPTSVNEETDLYGSGFYPNGDEIRTN